MTFLKKNFRVFLFLLLSVVAFVFLFLRFRKQVSLGDDGIKQEKTVIKDSIITVPLYTALIDMEQPDDRISPEKAFSGKHSCKLSDQVEYGIPFSKRMNDIPGFQNILSLDVSFKVFSPKTNLDAVVVLAIDGREARNLLWESAPIKINTVSDWNTVAATFKFKPELLNPENNINVYVWNKSKEIFYVDDLSLSFIGTEHISTRFQEASNTNFYYDFETVEGLTGTDNIKNTTSHSGAKACDLSSGEEYGPSVTKKISDVTSDSLKKIGMSVWIYPLNDDPNVVFTVSVSNDKGESIYWNGESSEGAHFKKNKWWKINAAFNLPAEKFSPDDKITVNIWNKGRDKVIMDDIEIVYGNPSDRKGFPSKMNANVIYEKQYVPLKNVPPFKHLYLEMQEINLSSFNDYNPNDEFLSGNFDLKNNSLDELICVKGKKAKMFSYARETKSFKVVWEQKAADSLWSKETIKFSGDFNSDGIADVLSVDSKTGGWQLWDYKNDNWTSVLNGNVPLAKKWLKRDNVHVSGLFTKNRTDALVIINNNICTTLLLNEKKKLFEEMETRIGNSASNIIKNTDVLFTGNFDEDPEKEIVQFNSEWRFDLKLLKLNQNEVTIAYSLDFKGYKNDYNPKYYERSVLISSNFTDNKYTSFLVFSYNCLDSDFKGADCKRFENLPYLPNSINLYLPGKIHE